MRFPFSSDQHLLLVPASMGETSMSVQGLDVLSVMILPYE